MIMETTTLLAHLCSNETNTGTPLFVGYIGTAVAVISYGSNFVPVKKFETGDGMFFQWILCSAIFLSGLVLQMVQRSTFYPFVMIGGVIWSAGNICVVPIIKTIGLGLGLCIWGIFNLLGGWASGRFGWFGINAEPPKQSGMNYAGVALCVFSCLIYSMVKPEISASRLEMTIEVSDTDTEPLMNSAHEESRSHSGSLYGTATDDILIFNKKRSSGSINRSGEDLIFSRNENETIFDRFSPVQKRIFGILLSVFSGVCYGLMFVPAIHTMDNETGASCNSLDYVFAHFCGIYLSSSAFFVIYIIFMKNRPRIYPRVILPGIISGIMWAVATGCWFVANKVLSEPVSFPIITTMPGAIASLFWGVIVFKEIRGRRNILILLLGLCFTVSGAVLAGVSKV